VCERLYYRGLCKYTLRTTFAQRRNRITTHFTERIPVVKRRNAPYSSSTITGLLNLLCGAENTKCNTGRFIMFSLITNIYNKKTKGPDLMKLFTAKGKLKKFFLTTRDVRCVHHGWHSTHRYDIQVVATHACVATTWISYRCVTPGAHMEHL